MTGSFGGILVENSSFGTNGFGNLNEFFFNGFTKSTDHKTDFGDGIAAYGCDVFDEPIHYGFTGHFNERFGSGKGMGAHSFAHSGHRDNQFHVLELCVD